MTTVNFAYTVPFPKDSKITQEQAFNGLRIKARNPTKFVPIMVSSEVLEEKPEGVKIKVTMKHGDVLVQNVSFHAPAVVTFSAEGGHYVTNVISETSDGSLLLTATFKWKLEGGGSDIAIAKFKDGAKQGVETTLKTILELHEQGGLN
ncbi:hypothetical protein BDV93DRAFT_603087 [Ceratobasidium sp. AG-I]|nr:hypothetical protein BDV93DRAFT_603087 [Ceratobasidium sp. AG-I]